MERRLLKAAYCSVAVMECIIQSVLETEPGQLLLLLVTLIGPPSASLPYPTGSFFGSCLGGTTYHGGPLQGGVTPPSPHCASVNSPPKTSSTGTVGQYQTLRVGCHNLGMSQLHYNACNGNNLSILYFNARSIVPRLDELKAIVESEQPLVVCIVETWLSADISNEEISILGYQLLRADRNRQGGGVLMYLAESLSSAILLSAPFGLELLLVSITPSSPPYSKYCIGVFYRPPASKSDIIDYFSTSLSLLDSIYFSKLILVGDFNIDFLCPGSPLYRRMSNIMNIFDLHQVVPSYTHVSPSGATSLLDLALLSASLQLLDCSIIPPLVNSDCTYIPLWAPYHNKAHTFIFPQVVLCSTNNLEVQVC